MSGIPSRFPTGEVLRYLLISASIPQHLSGFQRVLNALLRFALAAKRLERLSLQIEQVLLADGCTWSDVPSTQDFGDLPSQFHLIFGDVLALPHEVHSHLERREYVLSGSGDVSAGRGRLVTRPNKFEGAPLGIT